MTSPAAQYVDSILKELHERALDRTRDDSIHAARTILQYDIAHQRCTAYIERCQTLNNRTSRLPPPTNRNSSAPSASSAVNSSPQTDDYLIDLPPNATLKEIIIETLAPGPKSRADYQRAFNAAVQQNADLHAEHQAMRAELNVFRSERLGSITTEKREELLAMRYETNKRRREHQPIPFFIKDLTPEELTQLNNRQPDQPEVIDTKRDREGASPSPPSPPPPPSHDPSLPSPMGEMSRGSASDREGKSPPQAASPKPQDSPAIPPCPSVTSVVKESMPPSAPSAISAVNSDLLPGFVRDPHGNILSPRAAARRANPNRYTFKPKKLTHPTPITRAKPNSS